MTEYPKSGHEGIQLRMKTGKWRARVRVGRRRHEVGEFDTLKEAVEARAKYVAKMVKAKEAPPCRD